MLHFEVLVIYLILVNGKISLKIGRQQYFKLFIVN